MSNDIHKVITNKIGPITGSVDSEINIEHMKNLEKQTLLVKEMIENIIDISKYKTRPEINFQSIGIMAYMNLIDIQKKINNNI